MVGILDGKVILVTGAGGGIGGASCEVFAKAGARLVLSDVSEEAGGEVLSRIRQSGGDATFVQADLASEEDIRDLVNAAVTQYGRLDGAFNNAGVEQRNKPLAELTISEWDRAIRIDLTAVFLCIKYEVLAMLESGGGSIVNTASSLGKVASARSCEYVAAKHGVVGLTKAAGADYGAKGIRVNAILPGVTRTPMIARLSEEPSTASMFEPIRLRHTMERFGEPKEIGEAVKWLLSDDSSFVNGTSIAVDGGYLSI